MCGALLIIGSVAWGLAVAGFYITWGKWPEYEDMLLATTLYAPLALPISFGGLCGKALMDSKTLAMILGFAYWPLLGVGLWRVLAHESRLWLALIAAIVWTSSYLWLVIAVGMMGI